LKNSSEKIAMSVSRNTLIGNVALTVIKLFAGVYGHSAAMLADAIHSLTDIISTVIVMVGIKLANKKADKEHPYGHERFECVAAVILSFILIATGAGIGWTGARQIFTSDYSALKIPGIIALAAAIISLLAKEGMYWYTRFAAKKTNSGALMADAWHHRSDALSSVGSFIGILGARLGLPILDPIAAILICLIIVKVAIDIFRDAIGKMTDTACDDTFVDEISAVVLAHASILGIDQIKTRLFGDKIYVDMEISTIGDATLNEAHDIAKQVHDEIEAKFPRVKHCMIHMNPGDTIDNDSTDA
jgi:cation diffusion facilitator family transporter